MINFTFVLCTVFTLPFSFVMQFTSPYLLCVHPVRIFAYCGNNYYNNYHRNNYLRHGFYPTTFCLSFTNSTIPASLLGCFTFLQYDTPAIHYQQKILFYSFTYFLYITFTNITRVVFLLPPVFGKYKKTFWPHTWILFFHHLAPTME